MNRSKMVIAVMMVLAIFAVPASADVEVQIGLVLDGSGSISGAEWTIMKQGVASAVEDPNCVPDDGTVELTVVQFAGGLANNARLEVGPVVITTVNAAAVATTIRGMGQGGGGTPMAHGIHLTADTMAGSGEFDPAIKQVLNIATDGVPNVVDPAFPSNNALVNTVQARNYARTTLQMTDQDEIDAEGIGISNNNCNWLRDSIVFPQPGHIATIGDPASYIPGWVCVVANAQEFADSMCTKFRIITQEREYGDAPDPTYPSLLASDGARHDQTRTECLGLGITGADGKDFEPDANVPDTDLLDDGLLTFALLANNPAQTVDFEVTNNIALDDLIVNILLDLNADGDWNDVVGGQSEHVVRNQPIPLVGPADGIFTSQPFSTIGAADGPTWMRITLTRHEINPGWDGTMASAGWAVFPFGETEDWEVTIQTDDCPPVPVGPDTSEVTPLPDCEKICSTKVEQCDTETVMMLIPMPDAQIVEVASGGIYIDMAPNGDEIAAGDIRLTETCNEGQPNTKVVPHECDIGQAFTVLPQDIFTYMDSNVNTIFDVGDAIYLDVDNSEDVSIGDVRLTASPPFDVLDEPGGSTVIPAGEYGDAWSRVIQTDDDFGELLEEIGTGILPDDDAGTIQALGGTIDSDCSGSWTCPDKIYLNQPTGLWQFDEFVTIGDLRLYMPLGEECMPDCGTRVRQCANDAVYALRVDTGATWGYVDEINDDVFTPGDHLEGGYIDMDNDGTVSVGDVRVTSAASLAYPPNSKVMACDLFDLGDALETPAMFVNDPQTVFRYIDLGEPGYSLCDPVYMDVDDSLDVSEYDIRITQSPMCDILDTSGNVQVAAGAWGASWSIVQSMDYDAAYGGTPLTVLPEGAAGGEATVDDLLGYIDTDCNLCWSCPDKLYLQQLVFGAYDDFVTIGDIRLYVPPAAVGEGPDEPCWMPCGTKVQQCDVDLVYALMDMPDGAQVRYVDEDGDGVFSQKNPPNGIDGDGVYIDMDNSGIVSVGDIRLSHVCTMYPPNTKVGTDKQDNKDLGDPFALVTEDRVLFADIDEEPGYSLGDPLYLTMSAPYDTISLGDIRLTASPVYDGDYGDAGSAGAAWTRVVVGDDDLYWTTASGAPIVVLGELEDLTRMFDSDCSGTWTCPDKLYLQQTIGNFVTIGDERLYMPVSDDVGEPDLVITALACGEDNAYISYMVRNTGSVPAGAQTIGLYIGDTLVASDSAPALGAGATHSDKIYYDYTTPVTVKVCADINDVVDESNEYNNCMEVTCGGSSDPCDLYDTNGTPGIQKDEVLDAIGDYFTPGTGTTKETVLAVIGCYFSP